MKLPSFGHDARVNTLICCGHTLSHFYILMLPTMFLAWQKRSACRSLSSASRWR